MTTPSATGLSYLNAATAQAIDDALMQEHGWSLDQLMELAGLSAAQAIHDCFPLATTKKVLVVCGPGNNGGDGLVAARHLSLMDYEVAVCYPKRNEKAIFKGLVAQCSSFDIPLVDWSPDLPASSDIIIDAMFGFSFTGQPREPFATIIRDLSSVKSKALPKPKIVSIDIPSGWHVEQGDVGGNGLKPDALISLTSPKIGVKSFAGIHYLGGRFVSQKLAERFNMSLPSYPGSSSFVRLDSSITQEADEKRRVQDMRLSYERGGIDEGDVQFSKDPISIFKEWFDEACSLKASLEPNWISLASCSLDHRPSVRAVLLKGFDESGFVVFTNYSSRKGQELIANPNAAFSVYWEALQRQIRVEGTVEKLSAEESDEYFHSRPRSSQIGALVSHQSQVISSRAEIEAKDAELKAKYANEAIPIPRPEHWGGFRIRPLAMEFWQGRTGRLHDRIQFSRGSVNDQWSNPRRLQP